MLKRSIHALNPKIIRIQTTAAAKAENKKTFEPKLPVEGFTSLRLKQKP
jgi:hypothetical protein